MLLRLLVIVALAGMLAPGCGAPAPETDRSPATTEPSAAANPVAPVAPVAPAAQVPAVAALAIALPQVSGVSKGPEPEHAFTIQASSDAMAFDNEAAVNALLGDQGPAALSMVRAFASEHGGDVKAGLLTRGEVDRTRRRGHLIVPLFDLIAEAVARAKKQGAQLERPPQTTTALALDKELNMGSVLDVLYTGAKGDVRDYVAMVEGPAGRRAIPFSLPQPCTPAEQDGSCWSVAAFFDVHGLYLGLTQGSGCIPAPSAAPRQARSYLISGFDGKSPTVRGATLKMAGIDTVFFALAREEIQLCPNILLGTEIGTQWGDLVEVMAQLGRHFGVVYLEKPPIHKRWEEAIPVAGLAAAIAAPPEDLSDEEVWGRNAMQQIPVPVLAGTPPKIGLKPVVASGGFSRADVQKNTQAHSGEIRYCYQKTLRRAPAITGEIGFRLTIAADGKVTAIELDHDTLADAELRICLERSLRRWTYLSSKAPTTATTATVTWTLAPG